jgi:hypothetical protein
MGDNFTLHRGGRKSGGQGGKAHHRRKCKWPTPAKDRQCDRCGNQRGCCPQRGLPLDGEIDDDPAAKCDREPRHQPPGSNFGRRPFVQALCGPLREVDERLRPREGRPAPGRDPRPPRLSSSARPAPLDHRAVHPCCILPSHSTRCWRPWDGVAPTSTAPFVKGVAIPNGARALCGAGSAVDRRR